MYYGLFVKVGRSYVRVDTTTGFTIDTAHQVFAPLVRILDAQRLKYELRALPPVKLIDPAPADRRYAKTPW